MSVLSAERPREHNVIKQLKLKFECNFNFNFWLELQASRQERVCSVRTAAHSLEEVRTISSRAAAQLTRVT